MSERDRLEEQLHREIAQREQARREAAQQHTVLEQIIDTVPYSVFWKDRQSVYRGANRKKLRSLGLTSLDQLVGKTDFDTGVSREDAEFYRGVDRQVMEEGRQILNLEETQLRPDGPHVLLTSKVPLHDEEGAVTGVLGIYVDITDRKQMETELARAKEAAEEAARMRSKFIATISHELRTPLTLILGPTEEMLEGRAHDLPPSLRGRLERVRRNACRLYVLVNDLLDLSKLEAGRMEVHWEAVDVTAAVGETVDDARSVAENKGIRLTFAADPGIGVVVSDRNKLEKIVLDLVGNALKFTPPAGRIDVQLRALDDAIELVVSDSGPGIPLDRQGLVFQRFKQVDDWPNRRPGTGLGLALVKELAELMGGSVGLDSAPGRGSRFRVRLPFGVERRLPLVDAVERRPASYQFERLSTLFRQAHSAPAGAPSPEASSGHRPAVLVAEDDDDTAAYMRDILSDRYAVTVVSNGREALDAARRTPPEVIISDVMMPEMDGLSLVSCLKADADLRHIPVILVTARASRDETVTGLETGADDYVAKPFGPAELRARVRAAERQRQLFDDLAAKHEALEDAHEQLRATQEELIQAGKMAAVGTLAAGMSHELNNPLATILLTAQRLRRKLPPDSPLLASVDTIERHADRSGRLVRLLLDVSRRKPAELEPVTMDELVGRVAELASSQVHGGNLALEVDLPAAGLPAVRASVQELEVALLNLVKNALDASSDDGVVRLAVGNEQRQGVAGVEILVSDTGCGIPADALPHIFDPFFTTKPVGQGTGLGLALARRIIESHGGAIGVESGCGKGTTMRVWLPAAPESRAVAPPALPGLTRDQNGSLE
jgi:PAS domain S-box-containing protein